MPISFQNLKNQPIISENTHISVKKHPQLTTRSTEIVSEKDKNKKLQKYYILLAAWLY